MQAVPSSVSVSEKDWDKWQRDRGLPELLPPLLPLQGQGALVQQKRQHGGGQQPDLPPEETEELPPLPLPLPLPRSVVLLAYDREAQGHFL